MADKAKSENNTDPRAVSSYVPYPIQSNKN